MPHIMVDIETLGNNSRSVILSIGAVEFIPATSQIGRKFEIVVDPQTCVDVGMEVDMSTIMWWMDQSQQARDAFKRKGVSIHKALEQLAGFFHQCGDKPKVWGNGATFDNVILANAYALTKIDRPWPYWNDMCFRTMKNLYPSVKQDQIGAHHRAVDDAEYQARLLMKILVQAGIRNV